MPGFRSILLTLALVALVPVSTLAAPASPAKTIRIAPPAAWVTPPPPAPAIPDAADGALAIIANDVQSFAGPDGQQTYTAIRFRILRPAGLAAGNIAWVWPPDGGSLTLHWLRVIRGGQVTDLTHTAQFAVVQREPSLEMAMFDGRLTATYQIPGLAVGDEVEYATTVAYRDPTLAEARGDLLAGPQAALPGVARLRIAWPADSAMRWQATKDLHNPAAVTANGITEVRIDFTDHSPPDDRAQGAPQRYGIRRLLEFTSYPDWPTLSRRMAALFDRAATLSDTSPLRAEVARIAAATTDPVARAEAAILLAEDKIRYVAVELNAASLTPASADETWARRFGDCKAKTVLLVALLRGLGIEARPLLVNSEGIDGLPDRLPTLALFNHVVVLARINGQDVVIDATRSFDRHIANLPVPRFHQGLPLSPAGDPVMTLPSPPLNKPQLVEVIDIDASAGIGPKAHAGVREIYRGDAAQALRAGLGGMAPTDGERSLRKLLSQTQSWIDIDHIAWHADDDHGAFVIEYSGQADIEWDNEDGGGQYYTLPGGGFSPPDRLRRPHDQDASLPWMTNWPDYRCWVTTVHLPKPDADHQYRLNSSAVNRELGGIAYWRRGSLTGTTVRVIESKRTMVPEISAAAAAALNAGIATFDANKSWIDYEHHYKGAARPESTPPVFADTTDWTAPDAPCAAPAHGGPTG